MGKLEGKIALITGATSGMGEAFAKLFAKEGATIAVVGRNEERGKKVVEDITKNGGNATFFLCDISNSKSVKELRENYNRAFDRLDILVNNAGILITASLENINPEDWDKTFNVNTKAPMLVTQAFIDLVIASKGNILNVASTDGLDCNIRGTKNYMYSSSKAAYIHFTKYLALNYSNRIRVNCLCPGITKTPIWSNRDFSRFNSSIPMGRVCDASEVANVALFFVSDDASYVTGAVLPVDGGASLM